VSSATTTAYATKSLSLDSDVSGWLQQTEYCCRSSSSSTTTPPPSSSSSSSSSSCDSNAPSSSSTTTMTTAAASRRRTIVFLAVLSGYFFSSQPQFSSEVTAFNTPTTTCNKRVVSSHNRWRNEIVGRSSSSSSTWYSHPSQQLLSYGPSRIRFHSACGRNLHPLMATPASRTSTIDSGSSSNRNNINSNNKFDNNSSSSNKNDSNPRGSKYSTDQNRNNNGIDGFSRSFQSILSRTNNERQRFVTGRFPIVITTEDSPTLKWLKLGKRTPGKNIGGSSSNGGHDVSTTQLLVNGTTIDRSLASYDRFQWLDEKERCELHDRYATVSMELLAEIYIGKPGYLNILPSNGAGSSTALSRITGKDGTTKPWNRWRRDNDALYYREMERLEIQDAPYRDRLWVTGFSLAGRRGFIKSIDVHDGYIHSANPRSESMILWPNEVNHVPLDVVVAPQGSSPKTTTTATQQEEKERRRLQQQQRSMRELTQDALLVSDGFLVPGKDRGGIYIVKNPGHKSNEWSSCLTESVGGNSEQWFYHRAVWVDLTDDGRQSILTARAKLRKVGPPTSPRSGDDVENQKKLLNRNTYEGDSGFERSRPKNGQLVWLEMPKPHHFDEATGTPLEDDGTTFDPFSARHLPWKERILATGPDVMFAVADLDTDDDTIEVIASQFFDKKVTLHSIRRGPDPRVAFSRIIDDRCGAAFGGILANLDPQKKRNHRVIDSGSTVGCLRRHESFSHFLVTSHECDYDVEKGPAGSVRQQATNEMLNDDNTVMMSNGKQATLRGGSLFAYKVPEGKNAWRTESWSRTTVASGFRVKSQIWNVINPGAPGFCYTFHAHRDDHAKAKRPMIAVAGDCAESAYIFRPERKMSDAHDFSDLEQGLGGGDPHAQYKLMCEIKCGATVGSIAIGYGDLCSAEQESGYAKIYVPCFEKDKILVFALGSGEAVSEDNGDGW
jgi:hypothetical protein